jgi:hypothetical protein
MIFTLIFILELLLGPNHDLKTCLVILICRPSSKSHDFLFGTTTTPSYHLSKQLLLLKCSTVLSCCALSLGWPKGLRHYQSILKDWGDPCVGENSTYVFSRPRRSAISTRLPNIAAPKRELGDNIATIPLYVQILQMHLRESSFNSS